MAFWRCFYHFIWTTKNRAALITPDIEPSIFNSIAAKSSASECPILAINAVADHIHVAVCIPPKIAAADWLKNVKGSSTREVNAMFPDLPEHFYWQQSYGVLTFGAKNLDFVVDYIRRQKAHHANQELEAYLERTEDTE
jgi:putative transposase